MDVVLGSSPAALLKARAVGARLVETRGHLGGPYLTAPEGWEMGLQFWHSQLDVPCAAHAGRVAVLADGGFLRVAREGLSGVVKAEDVRRWGDFCLLLDQAAAVFREPGSWTGLERRPRFEVLRLPWMSLRELLDEWFASESLKGLLAEVALEGVRQGPFASGTAFHLIRAWARGEVLAPRVVLGGSSSFLRGVEILHVPGEPQLVWGDGAPAGLLLADGQLVSFDRLWVDRDARYLYRRLLSPAVLETEVNTMVSRLRMEGSWLRGAGRWTCPYPEELRNCVFHFSPGLRDLERAFDPLKYGLPSPAAPLTLSWPGSVDSGRDPELVQAACSYGGPLQTPFKLLGSWEPFFFESEWGFSGGHLWCGEADLSQMSFLRAPEVAGGVQLCGAAMHPGDYSGCV